MNLYKRDYSILTADEESEWERIKREDKEMNIAEFGELIIAYDSFRQFPKAARHFISYFPNHYLDIEELSEKERLTTQLDEFSKLLDSDGINERKILEFINCKHGYFLVASVLKYYTFGHHDAYLFPEFQLGLSHRADYLLVGKGSGGWEFVFVELEAPTGKITRKNGDLGEAFQKGLRQIEDWDTWLDANYTSLKENFKKHKNIEKTLPDEFTTMDKSRIHFVVVAGRRNNFNDKTYRTQRKKFNNENILILHYDNIIDSAQNIIGMATY